MRIVVTVIFAAAVLFATGGTSTPYEARRVVVVATAYCPCRLCCGAYANGLTATGRNAYRAGVAVDPTVIPVGARVDIPGYFRGAGGNGSWILADDVGGAIKGRRIDVRFGTHAEARRWGVRTVRVRVWTRSRRGRRESP